MSTNWNEVAAFVGVGGVIVAGAGVGYQLSERRRRTKECSRRNHRERRQRLGARCGNSRAQQEYTDAAR
jgi:hypothetical protein